jgi:hypothetical protein
MQRIVNLTPHPLVVAVPENPDDIGTMEALVEIPSSGIARCETTEVEVGTFADMPIVVTTFGAVVNLPEPQDGVAYVVSSITAQACRGRQDVFVPARPVRDAQGRITACRALGRIE